MAGLADLIPAPAGIGFKRARVIAVSGHTLTVDMGGPVEVPAVDSCTPRPDDTVLLVVEGQTMTAIAVVGGPVRQPTITVTSSTSETVTGLLNGVSTVIPKSGTFTADAADVCPLLWTADGSRVWCLPNEQQETSGPADGGGAGGAPGGVTSGKAVYAARSMSTWFTSYSKWVGGYARPSATQDGLIFYGSGRFRELQGRTLTGIRAYLPKASGPTSTVSIGLHSYSGQPGGAPIYSTLPVSRSIGGWVSLPTSFATALVGGDGTGGLMFGLVSGDALINSGGQIEISWRL